MCTLCFTAHRSIAVIELRLDSCFFLSLGIAKKRSSQLQVCKKYAPHDGIASACLMHIVLWNMLFIICLFRAIISGKNMEKHNPIWGKTQMTALFPGGFSCLLPFLAWLIVSDCQPNISVFRHSDIFVKFCELVRKHMKHPILFMTNCISS